MRLPHWLVIALIAVLAGACTTAEEDRSNPNHLEVDSPPAVTDIPNLPTVTGKSLPLEAYQLDSREMATISVARQLLIGDCLKRFGYTYEVIQGTSTPDDRLARRYGIADAAAAAKWGYGGPPESMAQPSRPPRNTDPNQILVLTGWPNGRAQPGRTPPPGQKVGGLEVPPGGCAGEAGRKLTGNDAGQLGDDPLVQDIDAAAYHSAEADKLVTEMQAKWSVCMKEKGYDYPNSLAVVDSLTRTGGEAPAAEIQLAVTDVECKHRTNYIGTWFTVESAYQNALIEKNFQTLTAIKARVEKTLSTATSTVAAGK